MSELFSHAKEGDRVIVTNTLGVSEAARIQKITSRTIRVSSCNLYRFNRNGLLCKRDSNNGKTKHSLYPLNNKTLPVPGQRRLYGN